MSKRFKVHPETPQRRLLTQAAACLRAGGVIVYPTDSSYALACCIGDKRAVDRIRAIRQLEQSHFMTIVCRDLSEVANYAKVDNSAFRLLKTHTPGPFTFILEATRDVPRRLQDPKRKSIGLRIPEHPVVQALLEALGEPMMSTTLKLAEDNYAISEVDELESRLAGKVDLILDAGACTLDQTTVVDLTGDAPRLVRQGLGRIAGLESGEDRQEEPEQVLTARARRSRRP